MFLHGYVFITNILHLYQLNTYILKKSFVDYLKCKKIGDIVLYFSSIFIFYLVFFLIDNFIFRVVLISIYNLFFFVYLLNFVGLVKEKDKKPLKFTRRIVRFIILYTFLYLALLVYFATIAKNPLFFNTIVFLLPLYSITIFFLTSFISKPVECFIRLYFLYKAKNKLKKRGDLIKIGITGSYGKTSTKFILDSILKEKYCVLSTPNSYNTPMGISKTIIENLENKHQVLIMEMGADKVGDIKYLCKAFKPSIGILTTIGKAHLESFKSVENIISTKCELPNNLYEKSLMCFNCDNKYIENFASSYKKDKVLIGKHFELCAKNIKVGSFGSEFDIFYKDEMFIAVKTCLLGEYNINNILLSVGVAIKLGLSKHQIIAGIKKIKPVKNRLELCRLNNGVILLNDGYNSNPNGCEMALKTLDMFVCNRKIVITPGMVELGSEQYKENYRYGLKISKVADLVFVVNKVNKDAIKNGLFDGNFDFNNVFFVNKFKEIDFTKFLNGDVVLIENDLPDNYN